MKHICIPRRYKPGDLPIAVVTDVSAERRKGRQATAEISGGFHLSFYPNAFLRRSGFLFECILGGFL